MSQPNPKPLLTIASVRARAEQRLMRSRERSFYVQSRNLAASIAQDLINSGEAKRILTDFFLAMDSTLDHVVTLQQSGEEALESMKLEGEICTNCEGLIDDGNHSPGTEDEDPEFCGSCKRARRDEARF